MTAERAAWVMPHASICSTRIKLFTSKTHCLLPDRAAGRGGRMMEKRDELNIRKMECLWDGKREEQKGVSKDKKRRGCLDSKDVHLSFGRREGGLEIMCSYLHPWFYDVLKDSLRCPPVCRCHRWHAVRAQIGKTRAGSKGDAALHILSSVRLLTHRGRLLFQRKLAENMLLPVTENVVMVKYDQWPSRPGTTGTPPSRQDKHSSHPLSPTYNPETPPSPHTTTVTHSHLHTQTQLPLYTPPTVHS